MTCPCTLQRFPESLGWDCPCEEEKALYERHTHVFILVGMDQFHKSLDDFLFIKPLKGGEKSSSVSAHLTKWKKSPLVQQKLMPGSPGIDSGMPV